MIPCVCKCDFSHKLFNRLDSASPSAATWEDFDVLVLPPCLCIGVSYFRRRESTFCGQACRFQIWWCRDIVGLYSHLSKPWIVNHSQPGNGIPDLVSRVLVLKDRKLIRSSTLGEDKIVGYFRWPKLIHQCRGRGHR